MDNSEVHNAACILLSMRHDTWEPNGIDRGQTQPVKPRDNWQARKYCTLPPAPPKRRSTIIPISSLLVTDAPKPARKGLFTPPNGVRDRLKSVAPAQRLTSVPSPVRSTAATPLVHRGVNTRHQHHFSIQKTDAEYSEHRPSKGERLCKNLACHLSEDTQVRELQEYLQQRVDKDAHDPTCPEDLVCTVLSGIGTGIGTDIDAGPPLTQQESVFIQAEGIPPARYRAIKARLFFGWACIIEQNLRGGSTALRNCHAFLSNKARYHCMNLGPSQAQWLCKGFDANKASAVCRKLQEWQWLPMSDCFVSDQGMLRVTGSVEKLFPAAIRTDFMRFAGRWDEVDGVPVENRMLVREVDLVREAAGALGWGCRCAVDRVHRGVGYVLPQGAKTNGSRLKRSSSSQLQIP